MGRGLLVTGAVDRKHLGIATFALAMACLVAVYFDTFVSIVHKWIDDDAYSHGFLIVPISLWLAWRQRDVLRGIPLRPSLAGLVMLAACVLTWIVARGSGVLVLEQFAVVAMVPALAWASLGWRHVRALAVPLGFLAFMVPFGRALVPILMSATADVATLLLRWSGVPVLRTHMLITIPGGWFEVARACSGLNYFTTSLVLGCLYAYVNYRGWRKRLLCVAAFVAIPVVLNSLRVYLTILVSHLTDMRFGPGTEHITFGKIFFVVMMLAFFWIGRRWHDEPHNDHALGRSVRPEASVARPSAFWPVLLALPILLAGPRLAQAMAVRVRSAVDGAADLIVLPPAAQGWRGPTQGTGRWRPLYNSPIVERQWVDSGPSTAPVDVYVGVYGLGVTAGAEMVAYQNRIATNEFERLAQTATRRVTLPDGNALRLNEVMLDEAPSGRIVWQWFVVGDRTSPDAFVVKMLEAWALVAGTATTERIVAISTPRDEGTEARLQAFLAAYGRCAVEGFPPAACAP